MIAFLCLVATIADGDTFTCADRTHVRIAAVNARELHGDPCPRGRPCPKMPAQEARSVLAGMIQGQTLSCAPVGSSYGRVVATCSVQGRDVGCGLLRAGAVAWWPGYARRYRIRDCRGLRVRG